MLKRFLVLTLLISVQEIIIAQNEEKEANLKAAFIYNFTRYIDWNTDSVGNNFVIGIIGTSPVADALNEIARTNTVNNKKIIIRTYDRPEDITFCDILFIPQNLPFPLESILKKAGNGVLTVGEEEGFAKKGTALNFIVVNEKLKFEANLKSLEAAGLKAGSQLLKLAIIIN